MKKEFFWAIADIGVFIFDLLELQTIEQKSSTCNRGKSVYRKDKFMN